MDFSGKKNINDTEVKLGDALFEIKLSQVSQIKNRRGYHDMIHTSLSAILRILFHCCFERLRPCIYMREGEEQRESESDRKRERGVAASAE